MRYIIEAVISTANTIFACFEQFAVSSYIAKTQGAFFGYYELGLCVVHGEYLDRELGHEFDMAISSVIFRICHSNVCEKSLSFVVVDNL